MNLPFRFYAFVLTLAALSGCATREQAAADHLTR